MVLCVYHFCVAEHMGKWEPPLMIFKRMSVSSFAPLPKLLGRPDWAGGEEWPGGRSRSQCHYPTPQVTQWLWCTRTVASPIWPGPHGTSSGGLCLSSRMWAERPTTSCQCWRASRYLLEKEPSCHHYYRWGSRDPRGKGVGSRANSRWGTPSEQNSASAPALCA